MKEPRPGLQKALRAVAVLLLVFSILSFIMVAFTFATSFFIGGQILSDGTGLIGALLRPNNHGRLAIDSALFGFAWLPGFSEVTVFFVYCCVLVAALRKRKKAGPAYPGAARFRVTLCVLAALCIALPLALWPVSAPLVAQSGTFTQPMPTPVPGAVLLALTLCGALLARRAAAKTAEEEAGDAA